MQKGMTKLEENNKKINDDKIGADKIGSHKNPVTGLFTNGQIAHGLKVRIVYVRLGLFTFVFVGELSVGE